MTYLNTDGVRTEAKIGDVVTVIGQSISMTVESFEANLNRVNCIWFDTRDRLQRS